MNKITPQSQSDANEQRDAYIYIPGLTNLPHQELDVIAQKIAAALDKNAQTVEAKFNFKIEEKYEEYGQKLRTKICTIFRKDSDKETPIIDIYEMSYSHKFTKRYREQNLFTRSFFVGTTILANIPRGVRGLLSFKASGKNLKEKLQIYYSLMLLFLLFVYMILLILAAIQVLKDLIPQFHIFIDNIFKVFNNVPLGEKLLKIAENSIVVLTALGLFTPQIKTFVEEVAPSYLSALDYLSLGSNRRGITGQLVELLEHIVEKQTIKYRRIHILSYSFGTIIALDALFPKNRMPVGRFSKIDTLITIGCPFDLIRTYWSSYFENRQALSNIPRRWLNVYSPLDALSSNFRNDEKLEAAECPIRVQDNSLESTGQGTPLKPENIPYLEGGTVGSMLDWLTLIGVRSHSGYWEGKDESEISCFYDVMSKMYEGDPLLR